MDSTSNHTFVTSSMSIFRMNDIFWTMYAFDGVYLAFSSALAQCI